EIEVYARELAATPESDRRRAALLLFEMGRRWAQKGNQPSAAQCLLKAYTLAPEFRPIIREARRMYESRSDFRLVVKLLDAEARASGRGQERAGLLRQKARVLEEYQADPAGAEAAYRAAAIEDPEDLSAVKAEVRLAGAMGDSAALHQALG